MRDHVVVNDHFLVKSGGFVNLGGGHHARLYKCLACSEAGRKDGPLMAAEWASRRDCMVDGMPGYQWYEAVFEL